jgi:hypothetical protein
MVENLVCHIGDFTSGNRLSVFGTAGWHNLHMQTMVIQLNIAVASAALAP